MTGRERVMTVINGGVPDRVPITLHNFQMAVERTGRPYNEVLQSGELLAEAMLNEWKEFKHDIILLEVGTACSAEAMGAEVKYDVDRSPYYRNDRKIDT
jgi:uroporphyrinogen-III decarboxylase